MPLQTFDFELDQGDSILEEVAYTDDNGDPVNLTGFTARMQVRKTAASSYAYLVLTSASGLSIDTDDGIITIAVSPASTALIPAGNYVYDLEVVDSSGYTEKLLAGKFILRGEVTR